MVNESTVSVAVLIQAARALGDRDPENALRGIESRNASATGCSSASGRPRRRRRPRRHKRCWKRCAMLEDLDLADLWRQPHILRYFRYPLHRRDFHELRVEARPMGHYAAKPLYARLTPQGRVDRSSGYSGEVAALFVPREAVTPGEAEVVLARMDPRYVVRPGGARNWPAIRAAAEGGIRDMLAARPSSDAERAGPR